MIVCSEESVREALHGLVILMVGGDQRPHHVERLRRALALEELVHRPTRRSDASQRAFAGALDHPRLVLVVCVRGLCRTAHGKVLHGECRRRGLPLLDCQRVPHPDALVAAIVRERRAAAVVARSRALRQSRPFGGAA